MRKVQGASWTTRGSRRVGVVIGLAIVAVIVAAGTPNLQAWTDQYHGVMKLRLWPDGYSWDYESAMESPTAPAGTPSSYSDSGYGACNTPRF